MSNVLEFLTPDEAAIVRKHRVKERARREHERILREEVKVLEALLYGTTWITKEGEVLPVSTMTPQHAGNAVRFAEGKAMRLVGHRAHLGIPGATHGPWPLVEALQARAVEEPSFLDRWRDRRSRRQFEKRRAAR